MQKLLIRPTEFKQLPAYLSGIMSGMPDYNYNLFYEIEAELIRIGFTNIHNPARHPKQSSYEAYLEYDLNVIKQCKVMILLPQWFTSLGVRREVKLANELGLQILTINGEDYVYELQIATGLSLQEWFDVPDDVLLSYKRAYFAINSAEYVDDLDQDEA